MDEMDADGEGAPGATAPSPSRAQPTAQARATSRGRALLWLGVALSWIVLLPLLWSAVTTLPSAERLEQTRTAAIPTLRTLVMVIALSAAEAAFALLLLWPRWRGAYTARLLGAAVVLGAWFVASTPLSMSRLDWVHRRWLALVAFGLMIVGVFRLGHRAVRWVARHVSRGARPQAGG